MKPVRRTGFFGALGEVVNPVRNGRVPPQDGEPDHQDGAERQAHRRRGRVLDGFERGQEPG